MAGSQGAPSFLQDADALAAQSVAPSFLSDADAALSETPDFLADADSALTPKAPDKNIFGKDATSLTMQAFRESLLTVPEGRERVYQAASKGGVDLLRLTFPELPFDMGRKPEAADFERAAEKYADFRPIWEGLKQRQAIGKEYANALYGDAPDWNMVERAWMESRFDEAAIGGKLQPDKAPAKQPPTAGIDLGLNESRKVLPVVSLGADGRLKMERAEPSLVELKTSPFDSQLNEWSKQRRQDGIPGVDRPPLTDEELADAAMFEIQSRAQKEVGSLPVVTEAAAKGLGGGLRMGAVIVPVGRVARAAGAAGEVLAPAAEGAALSVAEQAMSIATGARKDFSLGEVVTAAAALKLGAAAGQRLAVRFPESKRLMGTLGTLGTVEAVNKGVDLVNTGRLPLQGSETPGRDLVAGLIEAATSIGVAARMGASQSGQPKADLTEASRKSGKANFEATKTTDEALEAAIRKKTGLDPDKPALDKIEQKTVRATLKATVESVQKAQEYDRWLDEKSGGDAGKKASLHSDVLRTMEAFDLPAEKKPSLVTPPEVIAEGLPLLKAFGAAGLKIGEIRKNQDGIPEVRLRPKAEKDLLGGKPDGSEDYSFTKSEIDSGEAQVPGLDGGGPQIVRRGEIPKGWELVGGYDYSAKRGFFFPQMSPETELPGKRSPFANASKRAPEKHRLATRHETNKRELTFEDALLERALDIDVRNASKVFEDQAGKARDRMFLDLAREEGFVLREDQLPNADMRQQASGEIDGLTKRNLQLEAALRAREIDPLAQAQAADEILGNKRRIGELKQVMEETFYKQATGPEWGDYEGMYMHPSVMYRARQFIGKKSPVEHLGNVVNSAIKQNLVGSNLRAFLFDFLGNHITADAVGVDLSRKIETAIRIENLASKNVRFPSRDADNIAFDIMAKKTALGGPADITARDQAELTQLQADLAEAKRTGNKTALLKAARAFEKVSDIPNKALGGLPKWLSNKRIHLIDRAQARAMFLELVENGIDGSGPMEWTDAFEVVRKVSDYGKLPKFIQDYAPFLSMIRYPSKVVQAAGSVMERRPSIGGEPIPTPFDAVIEAKPGTPAAQRALLARGMTRIALVTAKYAVPVAAIAQTMSQQTGISKNELDQNLDAKLSWMSPPAREITKKFAIPTGRQGGDIEYIDGASLFPPVVALRYFWINFSGDTQPWYMQAAQSLAQKNVIAGPLYNVAARRNFAGQNVSEGYDRFKPLVQAMSPAMVMQPLEAAMQMANAPEEERNALRSLLKSVVGVPIELARDPTFSDKALVPMLEDLINQGVIGREDRDDGVSGMYVRKDFIGTELEKMAQVALDTYAQLKAANPRSASFKLKQLEENLSR